MKALIWIGCMTLSSVVQAICDSMVMLIPTSDDSSIILVSTLRGIVGAAVYGIGAWIAIRMCQKHDWNLAMQKVAETNMTVSEYGRQGLSETFLEKLTQMTDDQLKSVLKEAKKRGKITKEQYTILLKEYSRAQGEG